jgi:hypothetical protein
MATIISTRRPTGASVSEIQQASGKPGRRQRHPTANPGSRTKWRNRKRKGPEAWPLSQVLQLALRLAQALWEWSR